MATTIISLSVPIEFYDAAFEADPQFNSKHINDYKFADMIYPWQQKTKFKQPWQLNDSIRLQLRSDTGPNAWKLYTCEGVLIDSANFTQVLENADNPGEFIYQADIDLSPYDAGDYELRVEIGVGTGPGGAPQKILVSEPLIFSDYFENSLLLPYKNSSFFNEIIFETGYSPSIRIYGRLMYKTPSSKDTVYEDQELNETIVESKSFDLYELQLSDEYGIPDWLIRKMNMILGCDELVIDGRLFTKSEGSKLEPISQENYPMRGWKIELREQLNRRAKYFLSTGNANQKLSVVLNTDSKGFIEDETGGSEFQLLDIQ
jgi:hypothetical protein